MLEIKLYCFFHFVVDLDVYVTKNWPPKSTFLSKYFDSQSLKPVAKTAKLSSSVFLLFHATEKIYAGYLQKCFQDAYCLTAQAVHNC